MNAGEILNEFVLLWAVVDPIGTIPVFLAVAGALSVADQRRLAIKSVLVAAAVLLFFAVAGEMLLRSMGLALASFQIAGGIILFIFASGMIFGASKPDDEIAQIDKENDLAVFPLAIPSIASPGAIIAAVMMTDGHRYALSEQFASMLLLAIVLLSVLVLLWFASSIHRLIGRAGASVVSRIMGLLLAAVATDHVMKGIVEYIKMSGLAS